jgi:hypothetical protein
MSQYDCWQFNGAIMRNLSIFAVLSTAMLAPQIFADELELGLNDDAASVDWITPINRDAELQFGYLYSEPEGSLADISVHVTNDNGIHHLALGGQVIGMFADHRKDGYATALGGRYRVDLNNQFRFSLQGYYAPSILAFRDLDSYHSLDTRIEYVLMPNADLFVGYRHIKFDFEKNVPSLTFETGLFVGARFRF